MFNKQNRLGSLEERDLWGQEQQDWALSTSQRVLISLHSSPAIVPDYGFGGFFVCFVLFYFCSRRSHILVLILPIWGNFIVLCLLISHLEQQGGGFPLLPDGSEAS